MQKLMKINKTNNTVFLEKGGGGKLTFDEGFGGVNLGRDGEGCGAWSAAGGERCSVSIRVEGT